MASNQLEMFHIPNPCVGVCESNARGYCKGCLRSRDERFNWHQKSDQEQREIIERLGKRRARLLQAQKNPKTHADAQPGNFNLPGFTDD
ncbi:DUF1289 domain-containing protein [Aliidiomarina sp. Khilg15.8]